MPGLDSFHEDVINFGHEEAARMHATHNPGKRYNVGLFFEKTAVIYADNEQDALRKAGKWAEGIADTSQLTITDVQVSET